MTPKEKARELVDKYISIYNSHNWFYFHLAKQAAMLLVDELIIVCKYYNDTQAELNYWYEVKERISML